MNRKFLLVLPAFLVMACAGPEATDRETEPAELPADDAPADPPVDTAGGAAGDPVAGGTPPLTAQGWGPIRIGMSRAEVVAAVGEDANPGAVGGPEPEACDEFHPESAPAGLRVMIEQGRLTRITLSRDAEVRTPEGFGLGSPADSVEAAYGTRVTRTPHKYEEAPSAYLTVWEVAPPDPDARGIVYEIGSDGRVQHVHAGSSSIQYVEGCL